MKYTYLKGKGHIWRVLLPKMTEAQAMDLNQSHDFELRRLAWTAESARRKRGSK